MPEKVQNLVQFRYLDATQACFPENYFDVVYSRDAIMHIADKEPLYEKILVGVLIHYKYYVLGIIQTFVFFIIFIHFFVQTWLKPGGTLLNSEYVHGRNHPNLSRAYLDYLKDRCYQLLTVHDYGQLLKK